jgi:hypothetical protein
MLIQLFIQSVKLFVLSRKMISRIVPLHLDSCRWRRSIIQTFMYWQVTMTKILIPLFYHLLSVLFTLYPKDMNILYPNSYPLSRTQLVGLLGAYLVVCLVYCAISMLEPNFSVWCFLSVNNAQCYHFG